MPLFLCGLFLFKGCFIMVRFKKLSFVLAIVLIVCFIPTNVLAVPTDKSSGNTDAKIGVKATANTEEITYKKDIKVTEQFLVNITRPANKESTANTSYIICGNTEKEGVIIELFIYSKTDECYIPFKDADEEYGWEIGSFFSKEVELMKKANDIMIIAYQKAAPEVVQVSKFTITVLGGSIKDIIKRRINKTIDLVKNILGK